MDWRDEGILLNTRPHGETGAIVEVLTSAHGRHAGMVRGARGSKLSAVLQPSAQLSVSWRARDEDGLGSLHVEPVAARAGVLMEDRATLAAFNAMASLILAFVPERQPDYDLYEATHELLDLMVERQRSWPGAYAWWELVLLAVLGFGLDLDRCAATGTRADLAYVSPKTGRAVSREAGGPYADRLLPLPAFLVSQGPVTMAGVRGALRLTGWFLERRVVPAMEQHALPPARARLLAAFETMELPPRTDEVREATIAQHWTRRLGIERRHRDTTVQKL